MTFAWFTESVPFRIGSKTFASFRRSVERKMSPFPVSGIRDLYANRSLFTAFIIFPSLNFTIRSNSRYRPSFLLSFLSDSNSSSRAQKGIVSTIRYAVYVTEIQKSPGERKTAATSRRILPSPDGERD